MAAVINCIKISIMHQLIIIIYIYSNNSAVYNRTRIYPQLFILVTVFGLKVTSITAPPGFGYTLLFVRRNAIVVVVSKGNN